MIMTPINETLPATGAGAVLVSLGTDQDSTDFLIQARGAVDMLISDVAALTTYFTVKSGTIASLNQVLGKGSKAFYAESGSTASVVEVLPIRK